MIGVCYSLVHPYSFGATVLFILFLLLCSGLYPQHLDFHFYDLKQIFSERRGQWKAATQSQEFLRTLQRYYSNAYVDAEKQDAINVYVDLLFVSD